MVIGYHLILSMYGFWLPNDPRGSWSDFVRAWELVLASGRTTKTDTRRSVAGLHHDLALRRAGKNALVRAPVCLTGTQAIAIGSGFERFMATAPFEIHACSNMPAHTHLVLSRPPYLVEQAANVLKGSATRELSSRQLHPFQNLVRPPTPWARKQWACYLNTPDDIERAMRYVEKNPLKDVLPAQSWRFVVPV